MSLARRLMQSALPTPPPAGQQQWTPGSYTFVVPAGVFFISACGVAGGCAGSGASFNGGGAGGLHWRNLIPVTPGESLTVEVGAANTTGSIIGGGDTRLLRGATVLLLATGGQAGTGAGNGRFDLYGGGGGEGGRGNVGGGGDGGFGGGAAGYVGDGGRGGSYTSTAGGFPTADSGGGLGGNRLTPGNGWTFTYGQGVGLQGRNPGRTPGSLGTPRCGGGMPNVGFSISSVEAQGGLRIMWGDGRSYPDAAANV